MLCDLLYSQNFNNHPVPESKTQISCQPQYLSLSRLKLSISIFCSIFLDQHHIDIFKTHSYKTKLFTFPPKLSLPRYYIFVYSSTIFPLKLSNSCSLNSSPSSQAVNICIPIELRKHISSSSTPVESHCHYSSPLILHSARSCRTS